MAIVVLAIAAAIVAIPSIALVVVLSKGRRQGRPAAPARPHRERLEIADPADALRAEQRARRALCEIVSAEEWAMYQELGFLRVWGNDPHGPTQGGTRATRAGAPYAFLIYPHRPVISYLPQTRELLGEFTISAGGAEGDERLRRSEGADASDVLATWVELTGCEREAIGTAAFHLPGRECDPARVRRDLWRLQQWEQQQLRRAWRSRDRPPANN